MSLILDALKKSDNERKTNIAPDMAATPAARERQGPPLWLWWFVGLLIVNLVVLLFVLTRTDAEPAQTAGQRALSTTPATVQSTPAPLPAKQPVESLASAAVPPRPDVQPATTAPAPRQGTVTYASEPAAGESAVTRPAATVQPPVEAPPDNDLPLFATLQAEGRLALDELNIDLHVYNADPARRFVFINGARYNEGETLSSGPRVDRIRRDGIEMSYRGLAFLLPRD
ncbi:MAG: general secretion pathway protein GspB [Pseudomonadota bacterium]